MRKGLILIATVLVGSLFVEQSFASYKYDFGVDLTSKSKGGKTQIKISDKGVKIHSKTQNKKGNTDIYLSEKRKRIRAGSKKGKVDISF